MCGGDITDPAGSVSGMVIPLKGIHVQSLSFTGQSLPQCVNVPVGLFISSSLNYFDVKVIKKGGV